MYRIIHALVRHSLNITGAFLGVSTVHIFKAASTTIQIVPLTSSTNMSAASLETLNFDNLALRTLPIDPIKENYVRQVSGACFSRVQPLPVRSPSTVAYSEDAMALLDLPVSELKRSDFATYFSGNALLPGSEPAAHCYCGHQFGYFSGQLGDGAAMYLGEVVNRKGERWEFQFKGAGKTPYSRTADGRKVLRSSIREFLCSEAMYYLGVPTTRAGACVTSETGVIRDIFYTGKNITEKATIVTRIAPTFIRFGSFEIFKTMSPESGRAGPSVGRYEIQKKMLDYCVSTFYPEIDTAHKNSSVPKYRSFYKEVVLRTARMVADWQCVGFCHGVMNTDNMSIMGLTIDYGPFGFIDRYNPGHVCNASDDGARYTYVNQPAMCRWNLRKFAEALHPTLPLDQSSKEMDAFDREYKRCYLLKMRRKLGLIRRELPEDEDLVSGFLDTMEATGGDFTNCFRALSILSMPGCSNHDESKKRLLQRLLEQCCTVDELKRGAGRPMDDGQFHVLMMLYNTQPEVLEQIGKGKAAVEREIKRREDAAKLKNMTADDKRKTDSAAWTEWVTKYCDRLEKEAVFSAADSASASSATSSAARGSSSSSSGSRGDVEGLNLSRVRVMNSSNPRFVLRNYIAQNAIHAAEHGDYAEVQRVLEVLKDPYAEHKVDDLEVSPERPTQAGGVRDESDAGAAAAASGGATCRVIKYDDRPPSWANQLLVT